MKLKSMIILALIVALMLIIAGCTGSKSGSLTSEKTFASMKEAYDSGLSLKCTGKASVYTMNLYFSNKNIKTESIGPAQTIYQIITSDDHAYMWSSASPEKLVSISGDGAKQTRTAFLNGPLTIPCTEQLLDPSLFEPPK